MPPWRPGDGPQGGAGGGGGPEAEWTVFAFFLVPICFGTGRVKNCWEEDVDVVCKMHSVCEGVF